MYAKSHTQQARAWMQQHQYVGGDWQRSVQRVEADAAAVGIVDGVGQQMIDVDQQPGKHDQVTAAPFLTVDRYCNQQRHEEMQCDVDDGFVLAAVLLRRNAGGVHAVDTVDGNPRVLE